MVTSTDEPGSPDPRTGKLARSARMVECQRACCAALQFTNIKANAIKSILLLQAGKVTAQSILCWPVHFNETCLSQKTENGSTPRVLQTGGESLKQAAKLCSCAMSI